MTALRFIKPLDKIELGVAEIINGNIDYQFRPVGPDFEGLSNGLNVMLARLLGREEPNEDEPEEEQDETHALALGPDAGRGGLRRRPARRRPTRTRSARRASRSTTRASSTSTSRRCKSQGKPTKGITVQAFTAKLRLIEGGLKQKWKCRMVRFKVNAQGEQVTLKPIPIN